MSVLEFYGLQQEPFSNAPVSHFYYESPQTHGALVRLHRVVDQMRGLAVVIGAIGAGKTTLARKFLDELSDKHCEAGLLVVVHSGSDPNWMLKRIAQQMGVTDPKANRLELMTQLYQRLLEIHHSGKKAVVLIDEAQMLQTQEIMEEFRGLLNLELPECKLVTFIFFGLPELDQRLRLDPPLLQRVALRIKLESMDLQSCMDYIHHRLKKAGAIKDVFTQSALHTIFGFSLGSPRLINTIADNAIFEGALTQAHTISADIIERVAMDLGLESGPDLVCPTELKDPVESCELRVEAKGLFDQSILDDVVLVDAPVGSEDFDFISDSSLRSSEKLHLDSHGPSGPSVSSSATSARAQQSHETTDEREFLRQEDTELEDVDDILSHLDEI